MAATGGGTGDHDRAVAPRDAAVAAAAMLLSLVLYSPARVTGAGADSWEVATSVALTAAQAAPLVWRRRHPQGVAAAVLGSALLQAALIGPVAPYPVWFALAAVVLHVATPRVAAVSGGAALLAAVVVHVTGPVVHGRGGQGLLAQLLLTVVVGLAAGLVRMERERLDALRQRASSLERERDAAAREAAAQERLRIARDLHDLVGHGLSSIAVQSSTARVLLEAGDAAAAGDRLRAVESTSRDAMREMRQLLGVLREDEPAALRPSPAASDIAPLVDAVREAGVDVELRMQGDLGLVPTGAGVTAYRVVQEGLTNVMKHAPQARVVVDIGVHADDVRIQVTDDGPPLPRSARGRGSGLLGMQERVALQGGRLSVGPIGPEGGWRIDAVIPQGADQ